MRNNSTNTIVYFSSVHLLFFSSPRFSIIIILLSQHSKEINQSQWACDMWINKMYFFSAFMCVKKFIADKCLTAQKINLDKFLSKIFFLHSDKMFLSLTIKSDSSGVICQVHCETHLKRYCQYWKRLNFFLASHRA